MKQSPDAVSKPYMHTCPSLALKRDFSTGILEIIVGSLLTALKNVRRSWGKSQVSLFMHIVFLSPGLSFVYRRTGSSRSSSSNETERERGRAGGEWGLFGVGGSASVSQNLNTMNPLNSTSVPLTRLFLKRSLSEPAAPRPTRPRLQLTPEDGIVDRDGEASLYDEKGNHGGNGGYDLGQLFAEAIPPSMSTMYSYSSSPSSSSVSPGGGYLPRRHHANSYPIPGSNSVRGRSGYPISHPYPIHSSEPSCVTPRIQINDVSSGLGDAVDEHLSSISTSPTSPQPSSASGTPSSDLSSLATMSFMVPSYSSFSYSLPAPEDTGNYDNENSNRINMTGQRSGSISPIRSQRSSAPLSAPLPYPYPRTHSDGMPQRRRAWSTRSTLTLNNTLIETSPEYHWPTGSLNSNATDVSLSPTHKDTHLRPASRASLPPSSPASPVGGELRSGRRNAFLNQSHRRTSTWGEHWSYFTSTNTDSSPSPSPSASPHREPISNNPNSAQTSLTWQQVESERRRGFATEFMEEEGDTVARMADKGKGIGVAQMMLPLWPTHGDLGPDLAGTDPETYQTSNMQSPSTSWIPASSGHVGYVASILDPHLQNPERDQSLKTHEEFANIHSHGQMEPSTTHRQPSPSPPFHHFPSSSYSSLSGWAGKEEENGLMESANSDSYPLRGEAIGEPVMTLRAPPSLYGFSSNSETIAGSQWKPRREDANWIMNTATDANSGQSSTP
ncbi:hypothetical protein F5879DRAFT_651672 [Lentinula edodes]|nr:hypothetical protein F5879DRAFT_651672 [Lentinula edodes]